MSMLSSVCKDTYTELSARKASMTESKSFTAALFSAFAAFNTGTISFSSAT